jgi:dTDP-4-dehydrorhamnose 3,5-epimerase
VEQRSATVKVVSQPFDGVIVLEPRVFGDDRGFFLESFELDRYRALGITEDFVQDNHSRSVRGVLRGMHFTRRKPQAQLLTVLRGKIFDVVVDIRRYSPTFGKWFGTELGDDGPRQLYMAHGFAHGFCVLSDVADLHYKVTQKYDPTDDGGLRWDDPDVAIRWPSNDFVVSSRDQRHKSLKDI